LFNKAAILLLSSSFCDVTNGKNFYAFSVCSSFVGWWWRSVNFPLLPS